MTNKIKNRKQLQKTKGLKTVYNWLSLNKPDLLNECLPSTKKIWSITEVLKSALKYRSRYDWQIKEGGAYRAARRLGCYHEAVKHMDIFKSRWTEDRILESAKKFNALMEWIKGDRKAYSAALRMSCLKKATEHMASSFILEEDIIKSARKYKRRSDWAKHDSSHYRAALRLNCFDKAVEHMIDSTSKCKPVINNNNCVFKSASSASILLSSSPGVVAQAIARGHKCAGLTWRYATEAEVELAKKEGRFYE